MLTFSLAPPVLALDPDDVLLPPLLAPELLLLDEEPHAAISAAAEIQAMTTKVRRRWCIA
jgi:hypothetical protein